jgi:mRNA interferase MazF
MIERRICRGDIYHASLNPIIGSEQGGYRPVLVIQNDRGNQYSPTVIVAAITSKPKNKMATHVVLRGIDGIEKDSVVLLEQIRTLDKRRLDDYMGMLDEQQMLKVDKALRVSIGMKKTYKPVILCLCSECVKPFYEADGICINLMKQNTKRICMLCNFRQGQKYWLKNWRTSHLY